MFDPSLRQTHRLTWIALLAALIAVGAYVYVPLGPIPFSMQTFFVLLAGFALGPVHGTSAAALYLAAGAVGLPVFSGGTSGVARLFGPAGGFLFGFIPLAAIAGMATTDRSRPLGWSRGLAWGALALTAAYALGVPWLKLVLGLGWRQALAVGLLPFLPGAVIKLFLAVATYRFLDARRLLPP